MLAYVVKVKHLLVFLMEMSKIQIPPTPHLSNYQKRKNLCHMHYLKHMHHKPGFDMVLNLRRTCVSLILLNTPVIRNLSFYLVTIYSYDGFFCFFTSVSSLRQTRHRMLRRWRSLTTYSSLWWLGVLKVLSSSSSSSSSFFQ